MQPRHDRLHYDPTWLTLGLPRPLNDKQQPVPYATPVPQHGEPALQARDCDFDFHLQRQHRCNMCGLELHQDDRHGIVPLHEATIHADRPPATEASVLDSWRMHRRCARLAIAHCPHLRPSGHVIVQCDNHGYFTSEQAQQAVLNHRPAPLPDPS